MTARARLLPPIISAVLVWMSLSGAGTGNETALQRKRQTGSIATRQVGKAEKPHFVKACGGSPAQCRRGD